MNANTIILIALIVLGVILLYIAYRKNFKVLNTPSVCLVTGGVKTGKSLLTVCLSMKAYRKAHRKWFFASRILHRKVEEPLYYTNVYTTFGNGRKPHKLDSRIRRVTLESLLRQERFAYKSVIYIQEASLMADNMDFKNVDRNIDLSLFAKLIAHETRGGQLYLDTQSVLDVHYAFKRVSSTFLFIQKNVNFGLFHILYVREMINTENGVNNFDDDVDETTRKVLIPCWWHHRYDRYEYSYLTDSLNVSEKGFEPKSGLVSFNTKYIERSMKKNEKEKDAS